MTRERHLAIDAVGAKHSGAAAVVLGTLAAAAACADIRRVTLYSSPATLRRFALPVAEWLHVEERPEEEQNLGARIRWLTGGLVATARRHGADALLALSGATSSAPDLPLTVFAQQTLPLSFEATARFAPSTWLRIFAIRAILWGACRHAHRVAVQTQWMREALVEQLGADPARVVVVGTTAKPLVAGSTPARLVGELQEARGSVVLYVGSDSPHKNVSLLAPAMREVRRARSQARLFATLPARHALESEDIVCLGYLDDESLAGWYSAAEVVVFPSLVESAGLPLIEAMAFGVPIVAADRPYAHDVCGDAALYFDPSDPGALADRIVTLLRDHALRARLGREGRLRAEQFRTARPYDRLIELALSTGDAPTPVEVVT